MYFQDNNKETNIDSEFNSKKQINFNKKKTLIIITIILILIIILVIFSKFRKPKIEYFLTLNGDTDIVLYRGNSYIDQGYVAYDNRGENYNNEVEVTGEVNTNIVGEYVINYKYRDIEKTRVINIIEQIRRQTLILLRGDNIVYLNLGEKYDDQGVEVIDSQNEQGLKDKVQVTNNIDYTKPGTYKINYSLKNNMGVEVTTERTVIIMNSDISINYDNTKYVNDKITINIYVKDNYFDYIQLPDKSNSNERKLEYEVTENGIYKFIIYSKDRTFKEQSIEINNIDKESPTGSCSAKIEKNTIISTNISDNIGISGYKYITDTQNTEFITTSNYTLDTVANTVTVEAVDIAGNISKINCSITKITPPPSSSSKSYSNKSSKGSSSKSSTSSNNNTNNSSTVKINNIIPCNGDRTKYNNKLNSIIATKGKKTRSTAAAIAKYISSEIDVKIPYFWAGGHWHFDWDGHNDVEKFRGFSPQWGCITTNYRKFNGTDQLPAGFDCTGFIAWVLFNSGFSKNEIGSWSGENYLTSLGGKKLSSISFKGSTGKIKAGDIVWRSGHMGMIIDISGSTVTIAHAKGVAYGLIVEKYSSDTGKQIGGTSDFSKVTLMDNYYV